MTKKQIITSFVNGATKGKASNLKIEGNKLINYYTVIAIRFGDGIILNKTKYSYTTSRNQSMIRYYGNIIDEYESDEFYDKFIEN